MKKLFSIFAIAAMLFASSCDKNTKEPTPEPQPEPKPGTVTFTLAGSAEETEGATDANQSKINSVIAAFFNEDGTFYTAAEPVAESGIYSCKIDSAGTYNMYVVANASQETADAIKAFTATSTAEDLAALKIAQDPAADQAYVMTAEPVKVTTAEESTTEAGAIEMTRMAAKFTIVNKIEGLAINKITFKNHVKETTLYSTGSTAAEALSTDEIAKDNQFFYSYENLNKDANAAEINIEFTYKEKDSTLNAVFENGVIGNRVYAVIIRGKDDANERYSEKGWEQGTSVNTGVDLAAFMTQEDYNKLLLVNKFAQYNVASIEGDNVTFCTSHNVFEGEEPTDENMLSGYFQMTSDLASKTFKGSDGKSYRIPTIYELSLLVVRGNFCRFGSPIPTMEIDEELSEPVFGNEFSGALKSTFGNQPKDPNDPNCREFISYAVRFEGTSQYAAYRYEPVGIANGAKEAYLKIWIKALKETTEFSKVSNDAFWTEDYIEIILPAASYKNKDGKLLYPGNYGWYWSTTEQLGNYNTLQFSKSAANTISQKYGQEYCTLRLVEAE